MGGAAGLPAAGRRLNRAAPRGDPAAAALAALREGREEQGLAALAPVLRGGGTTAREWQVAGLLHRALDDLAPAIDALTRAAALAPGDARVALGLAQARAEAGLPALAEFERARALAPDDPAVATARAAAMLAEGEGGRALAELDARLEAQPGWMAGHWLAARLRQMVPGSGRYDLSVERALVRYPREAALWQQLVFARMHAREYDRALKAAERGQALAPGAFDLVAAACLSELKRDAADAAFSRLPPPGDAPAAVHHLRHLLSRGRAGEAAALAERAATWSSGHLILPYRSIARRMTGDPRWAAEEGDERLVGVYDLSDRMPPPDRLADRLRLLHARSGQPLEQSVRGGTQTDGPLFARLEPEIRQLREAVVAAVRAHAERLPPRDASHPTLAPPRDRRVRFAGAWSVRLTGGGHHANHVHPDGWLSSALYVAVPPVAERGGERPGWLSLGQPDAALGLDLPPIRQVEPRPGRLVLFPSTMWHGTVPFDAGERLTVAFDVAYPR